MKSGAAVTIFQRARFGYNARRAWLRADTVWWVIMADSATREESGKPLVELSDLRLTLDSAAGAVNILRGIDLAITRGEALGVVGPSGSGKSTLVSVIAGLERPTSGSVRFDGRDLGAMSEDELAVLRRDHIGIVFQSFHLIPTMTALENVAISLELAGVRDAFDGARATLEQVGLGPRTGHYPAQLSGGEQQRVAIARAFVADPSLILADEPTGNLDGDTGRAIIDTLFSIRAGRGTTLVLITHDERIAERCDRVLGLRDGRIESDAAARTMGMAQTPDAAQ